MKKVLIPVFLAVILSAVLFLSGFQNSKNDQMRHIVVFKYKPGTEQAKIDQVTQAFVGLKDKIPGIVAFEHGVNDSPENKNLGFTHVYLLTFENAAARDAYLPHPEHKKFGQLLGELGVVEDAFVVDYSPLIKK